MGADETILKLELVLSPPAPCPCRASLFIGRASGSVDMFTIVT